MVEDNGLHKATDSDLPTDSEANDSDAPDSNRPSLSLERASMASQRTPPLRDTVRATLVPHAPVPGQRALSNSRLSIDSRRSSMEIRRRSYDSRQSSDGRRSISLSQHIDRSPISPVPQESFGSPTTASMDRETDSSAAIQSLDETNASASQILNRSDVFQAPTLHPPQRSISVDRLQRASQDTARSTRMSQMPRSSNEQGRSKLQKQRPSPTPINTNPPTPSEQEVNRPTPGSSYSFQNLIRAGTSPLQTASGIAGFLKTRSKRMSTLLASESMGYYEKVSGMWAGGSKHYGSVEGMPPDDDLLDENEERRDAVHAQRFREHFALPDSEQLVATWYCFLHRVLPLYGKIYLGSTFLCFRPLLPGVRLKVKSRKTPIQ
jgi:sterol 3beta-glucosyltransferase